MTEPKILVFAGSTRTGSLNEALAAYVARQLTALGAAVTHITLKEYRMPLYDGDLEASEGVPDAAKKLCALIYEHQGVFIAGPEYNSGITPLVKNTIDWVSRVERGQVFLGRVFALGAASNGRLGGYRSLIHTRHVLELGCTAVVQPEMISVPQAANAYDEKGELLDPLQKTARRALDALIANARRYAA